jgi:hypothetical protein
MLQCSPTKDEAGADPLAAAADPPAPALPPPAPVVATTSHSILDDVVLAPQPMCRAGLFGSLVGRKGWAGRRSATVAPASLGVAFSTERSVQ